MSAVDPYSCTQCVHNASKWAFNAISLKRISLCIRCYSSFQCESHCLEIDRMNNSQQNNTEKKRQKNDLERRHRKIAHVQIIRRLIYFTSLFFAFAFNESTAISATHSFMKRRISRALISLYAPSFLLSIQTIIIIYSAN